MLVLTFVEISKEFVFRIVRVMRGMLFRSETFVSKMYQKVEEASYRESMA